MLFCCYFHSAEALKEPILYGCLCFAQLTGQIGSDLFMGLSLCFPYYCALAIYMSHNGQQNGHQDWKINVNNKYLQGLTLLDNVSDEVIIDSFFFLHQFSGLFYRPCPSWRKTTVGWERKMLVWSELWQNCQNQKNKFLSFFSCSFYDFFKASLLKLIAQLHRRCKIKHTAI